MASSPRVVGDARPDYHNIDSILGSPAFKGKRNEELVLAIYDHFTSPRDGTFHFWPADETASEPRIRRRVEDPVKLLNCYGYMICGQCAQMLHQLYSRAGLESRRYGVPGHNLCMVKWGGKWRHLDVDMWNWFKLPDGEIASPEELAADPVGLIQENELVSNPCLLPDRKREGYAAMYGNAKPPFAVQPDWQTHAYSPDFHLRPGESLTRSDRFDGRFDLPESWLGFIRQFGNEWRGRPLERYAPFRTAANGRWTYAPDLTDRTAQVKAGLWESDDLSQDGGGLVGPGEAVFRMHSAYPLSGIPRIEAGRIVMSNGVWLDLAGEGPLRVWISTPEGGRETLAEFASAFDRRIDVTASLSGRSDFLLGFEFGSSARLARFIFDGYVQVAAMSMPLLLEGENPFEIRTGDRHGLDTVPWDFIADFREPSNPDCGAALLENARAESYCPGFRQLAPASAGPVRGVWRIDAPEGRPLRWLYCQAQMREASPNEPERRARVEWSTDGGSWRPVGERAIPATGLGWDTDIAEDVVFGSPLSSVLVRVTSDTPITAVELYGHIEVPAHDGRLEVTHRYAEAGVEKEFRVPQGARNYSIRCETAPRDHRIEMRVT